MLSALLLVLAIGLSLFAVLGGPRTLSRLLQVGGSSASTQNTELQARSNASSYGETTFTTCDTETLYYHYSEPQPGPEFSTSVDCNNTVTSISDGNMSFDEGVVFGLGGLSGSPIYSALSPYLQGSYNATLVYLKPRNSDYFQFGIFNVTGVQSVTGNWTTGYNVAYSHNELINVSAAGVVTHVAVYPLPDRNYTISYSSQQQQVIQIAMSNSTVRGDMYGGPYYVEYAEPYITGGTCPGSAHIFLYQVDGQNAVGVIVNCPGGKVSYVYGDFYWSKWGLAERLFTP